MFKETIRRIFNAGWTNFKRNSYMSFGTTGVMVMVLLLFTGLLVLNFLSSTMVSTLQDKVDVSAYFKTEAAEEEIAAVKSDLEKLPTVKYVSYISRDQALAEFKQRHAGDALIQESLADLDENPLQASLNIKAVQSNQYASIVNSLEGNKLRPLIDKINFYENEPVIKRIQSIADGLQNWGLLAIFFLATIAVLVAFNTIRLTIYNQKQEVEIMRLVGGSNWYIRGPFLVEGALYGLFAAVVALGMFYGALFFVSPKVAQIMPGANLMGYFAGNAGQVVLLLIAVGAILGIISSFIAIRRYLKI